MSEPEVPQKAPYIQSMEAGTYLFCTCGRSSQQPLCDGSHAGTDFAPLEFTLDKPGLVTLCGCKHTKTPPYCDGSHSYLK